MTWQQIRPLIKSFWLIYMAGFVTLFSAMYISLTATSPSPWGFSLLLFLLFGLLFAGSIFLFNMPAQYSHLYFLLQTIILLGLINLQPDLSYIIGVLFLPITSQAPLLLPRLPGFLWVFGYIAIAAINFLLSEGFTSYAISQSFLSAGGYLGFAAFGATVRQSEERRKQGEILFQDLQEAHEQLQRYTAQAETLAVAEERNRLAREMHDALGHRLTVAVVQLEGAKRLIPSDPDRAATIIDTMRTQLKEALAELRQAVGSLRNNHHALPYQNDQTTDSNETANSLESTNSLELAVSTLIHTFQSATGLPVDLTVSSHIPTLPAPHHQALYRAVQESLTNVQRHAQASHAWVNIALQDEQIHLTVRDDGQGFADNVPDGRFGLLGLRERATNLGGHLHVHNVPPNGAELQFTLPLPAVPHE